jgi:hypothetical protein
MGYRLPAHSRWYHIAHFVKSFALAIINGFPLLGVQFKMFSHRHKARSFKFVESELYILNAPCREYCFLGSRSPKAVNASAHIDFRYSQHLGRAC